MRLTEILNDFIEWKKKSQCIVAALKQSRLESEPHKNMSDALADLLRQVQQTYVGNYFPTIVTYRSQSMIIYRTPYSGWEYAPLLSDGGLGISTPSTSDRISSFDSSREAERAARKHLAQMVWNGEEERSWAIIDKDDQASFTIWAKYQKRVAYYKQGGMSQEEAEKAALS
jgi:hypothetical protein